MQCLNKSLPFIKKLLNIIPSEAAVSYLLDKLGGNPSIEDVVAENQRLTKQAKLDAIGKEFQEKAMANVAMIESIVKKLPFNNYFRRNYTDKTLKKKLLELGLTQREVDYLEALDAKSSRERLNFSVLLANEYSNQLKDNLLETRLAKMKMMEANKELDGMLLDFLTPLGVSLKELDSLKTTFGADAFGIADIMNKIIYATKNRKLDTLAEEVGHFYVEMIGTKGADNIGAQLMDKIGSWSGYQAIYEKYKTTYLTSEGKPNQNKIKKEAIAQAIAEAIVKRYATQNQSIPKEERAFWTVVLDFIKRVSSFFEKTPNFKPIEVVADEIAQKIFNKDYSDILSRIEDVKRKNGQLKTYEGTLEDIPYVKSVIDKIISFGGVLTGSLALRAQGTVYRNVNEKIHDLDFSIDFDKYLGNWQNYIDNFKKEFPNYYPLSEKPYPGNNGEKVLNGIITDKPELARRFRSMGGDFNSRLEKFTQEEQDEMLLIDFFFNPEGYKTSSYKGLQDAGTIFNAKSFMGMRPKDVFDLLNFKPYESLKEPSAYSYYQLSENEENIKPGVAELFESNPELAQIGTAEQYSQYLDTIFPNSKVKDIVYHNTNEKFDKFRDIPVAKFFTKSPLGGRKYRIPALLNMSNPKVFDEFTEDDERTYGISEMYAKNKEKDSIINGTEGKTRTEYIVFEPEQIHILGNKEDVEGFKEFVGQKEQPSEPMMQLEEMPMSTASESTIAKVKEVLKKMGVNIQELATYAKKAGLDLSGVNAVADIAAKLIAIAQGKENVALTEEMVHIATAILEQKNPNLVTQMISKIERFKIYKQTFKAYKNNPAYQLPNGKPDIRKIKKEAVDKLISELIVNSNEGTTEYPELREEENRSIIRQWWNNIIDWFRGMSKDSNIDIFEEAASTIMSGELTSEGVDLNRYERFFQVATPTKAQDVVRQRIANTKNNDLKKVEDKTVEINPLLADTEEASNYYERKQPDGTWKRVTKRVTDRVKSWYRKRFGDKEFTKEEKEFNEFKRQYGVKGHAFFEEIHGRYYNTDASSSLYGTRKLNPDPRPLIKDPTDKEIYRKLEKYYTDLIAKFSEGGKNPLVFSEVMLYDPKENEAGTIDILIVEESGKGNIVDWKFMTVSEHSNDVPWYKQGAYNVQLGRYKDILKQNYGVKEIGMNRAVPILMEIQNINPRNPKSKRIVKGIAIGSVDTTQIEDLRLLPVSEETESTGYPMLDELIRQLNAVYKQVSKKVVTEDEEREYKNERLNILKMAIRAIQGKDDIAPLVNVIQLMRQQGDELLEDYETIYKNRKANSQDLTDEKLSEYAANLREYVAFSEVFGRVDDMIGDLVYTKEMEKDAVTEEEKEDVAFRKELLNNIISEARQIRLSSKEVKKISGEFADKFIGLRNLVQGLLKPEAIVKGLSSTFRGISELPMASLQILFKLVTNAKNKASKDALTRVERIMNIRQKLVARGGDTRKLIQEIYQKDEKGNVVNKLIYKFKKEFYDEVKNNAVEGKRSKKWLLDNINVDEYKKEAAEMLRKREERLRKTYPENEDLLERMIEEERRKWDISHPNFSGWSNPIIKRHPKNDWLSEEYKKIQKDPDLLELFNFITEMNSEAKSIGYISNKLATSFLPFVRKSMAESLAWDFDLSAVMNFGNSLTLNPEDSGKLNEITGELENGIPKYYTYDFTRKEDGTNDYSEVSEDLFKNMIMYVNHVQKYKYLTQVEDQIKLVKDIETFKGYLATNSEGNVEYDINDKQLVMAEGKASSESNAKLFNDFLRALLYEEKYPLSDSDTPLGVGKTLDFMKKAINKVAGKEVFKDTDKPTAISLVKSMEALNKGFQLKTLGFEFISGAVNAFGGNVQIAAQSGNYFKSREVLANEMKLIGNRFKNDDERKMFLQLVDTFMPLKDDPTYDKLQKSGLTLATQMNIVDYLMVFMREPEQHLEKSVFLTLLDNTMVENGRLVNIREYVKNKYKDRGKSAASYREASKKIDEEIEQLKKTRSISNTKKLEDGKLVIPGLDLNNINEIQRLTNLTRRISRNATGGMSDTDVNRMGMSIWTKSMMVFKGWIPKLVDTRFGEFRQISDDFSTELVETDEGMMTIGEKYDIGRLRLFANFLSINIFKTAKQLHDVISVTDEGIELIDKLYNKYAEEYKQKTGKDLTMSKEDFIDMVRINLRNQVKELAMLVSLFGAALSLGLIAPDDDDDNDKASRNFHRFAQRVVDKFVGELSFFYNPVEFQKILSGSAFPALGLVSDITRFFSHFAMETTGIDITDLEKSSEEVQKKAQPVKNLMKMFPFTKSLVTYLAIMDAEFAKEYDVTIQKESRR